MLKKNNKLILWIALVLFVVAIYTFLCWWVFNENLSRINYKRFNDCKGVYSLINPEIACIVSSHENYLEKNVIIESKIKSFIDYSTRNKKANNVSVFIRDLSTKQWIGINENVNFAPASLLKLPLLIAYYKLSEIEPDIFYQKNIYNGPSEFNDKMQNIKPEKTLEPGKEYTIEELLYRMIVYSDNNALEFLFKLIDNNFVNKVFIDLGIYVPTSSNLETKFLSSKTYGGILRALFNSNYLKPQNSEKVLDLLTKTTFNDGLKAGVPKEIKIAHKFGERRLVDQENNTVSQNLYDCGIVYGPSSSYILCVMTNGSNLGNLKEIIKNISQITYQEFNK